MILPPAPPPPGPASDADRLTISMRYHAADHREHAAVLDQLAELEREAAERADREADDTEADQDNGLTCYPRQTAEYKARSRTRSRLAANLDHLADLETDEEAEAEARIRAADQRRRAKQDRDAAQFRRPPDQRRETQ